MSYVTSVYIVVDYASPEFERAAAAESHFGREDGFPTALRELSTDGAGGTKYPGGAVFAAGLNYADRDALIGWIDRLPWSEYTRGVALIETEGDYLQIIAYRPEKTLLHSDASSLD